MKNCLSAGKLHMFILTGLLFCLLTGCHVKEGVYIPGAGTCYDYSYLNSLDGGKIGEPLSEVTITDKAASIRLYGSIEAAKTFQSYFPDDIESGAELDKWWNSSLKTLRSDKDIIRTIRNGFRRTQQNKSDILQWVSRRYGTPRNFFNKYSLKGYWLMYYASFSPEKDVRDTAVRYGIGRHRGGDADKIFKRMIQLAMADEHTDIATRMANQGSWQRDLMLKHLQPYLDSSNPRVVETAKSLQIAFNGNK